MFESVKSWKSKWLSGIFILLFLLVLPYPASSAEDIQERLDALEEQLLDLQLKETEQASVTAYNAIRFDFGGFLTQQFTANFNGDSPNEASFDQTNLELLLGGDVTERDSFFAAVGFLRRSFLQNEGSTADVTARQFGDFSSVAPGIIMWGKHTFSDWLDVTYGRFLDPWGIINVEHFPPVLMNLNQPQFLRPFGGNTIIPNFLDGVQVHGAFHVKDHTFDYYGYTSNFVGGNAKDFTTGGRLTWTLPGRIATLGTSYQNGIKTAAKQDHYNAFGADLKIDYKGFLLKSEYIISDVENRGKLQSYYIQPAYTLGKWVAFYRFDFIDLDRTATDDASEQTEHVIGINYLPVPTIRLRAEYVLNRFGAEKDVNGLDRAFDTVQISVTISF